MSNTPVSDGNNDKKVEKSEDDFAKFTLYQDSLKDSSTPTAAHGNSGNQNTCLISSSSNLSLILVSRIICRGADDDLLLYQIVKSVPKAPPNSVTPTVSLPHIGAPSIPDVPVDLPVGKWVVGCKWVLAVKTNPDGSIARLKARLVAKVDIENAFLRGDLEEEIYMEQPLGFVAQGEYGQMRKKVCYLRKSLYGLKQSPRAWYGKFSKAIKRLGILTCKSDESVFYKRSGVDIILLVVYVDDIVIIGSDCVGIASLKSFLQDQFHTKDLDTLKYFLGVKVSRSKKGIFLSQRKYVMELLKKTEKLGSKPCSAPMAPNIQLTHDEKLFDNAKSEDQLGDLFTKALTGIRMDYLCDKLGLINIYEPT
ncbi:transmembrane signal receptor [Lithospermum erythrorhizon]|uniref:Transmembrane signal receptor n=1 Tax=Lithospermum erythrorhizon TaxID=34254 RepID=A0AAV3PSP8_LITER